MLFVKFFEPFLSSVVASLHAINTKKKETIRNAVMSWNFAKALTAGIKSLINCSKAWKIRPHRSVEYNVIL